MDPNTDDPEAKVKDEIKKFEAMTTRIIQIVVREFRKNELKEYTIERKMHVASILFKANVLDKMDQQLITDLDKCIFYDAFLALFKKAGGYNTPTSTKPNPPSTLPTPPVFPPVYKRGMPRRPRCLSPKTAALSTRAPRGRY
jgi:hypothetical protein